MKKKKKGNWKWTSPFFMRGYLFQFNFKITKRNGNRRKDVKFQEDMHIMKF